MKQTEIKRRLERSAAEIVARVEETWDGGSERPVCLNMLTDTDEPAAFYALDTSPTLAPTSDVSIG